MEITKERWEYLVNKIEDLMNSEIDLYYSDMYSKEVELIMSILKNNTPFEVCGDSHVVVENKPFNVVEK